MDIKNKIIIVLAIILFFIVKEILVYKYLETEETKAAVIWSCALAVVLGIVAILE